MQGWSAGEPEERMEESQHNSHCGSGGIDMGLYHCLQCLQECPDGGPLPPLQTGLDLKKQRILWKPPLSDFHWYLVTFSFIFLLNMSVVSNIVVYIFECVVLI